MVGGSRSTGNALLLPQNWRLQYLCQLKVFLLAAWRLRPTMVFTGILPVRLSKLPLYVILSSVFKFHSQVILVKSCDTGRYLKKYAMVTFVFTEM